MCTLAQKKELFVKKYGVGVEVKVPVPPTTIRDNEPSPFSSGSNGSITKLRVNKDTLQLEYYHNWWSYGWYSEGYAEQVCQALNQVI